MPAKARQHKAYIERWCSAMRAGFINGRPFSQETVKTYRYYVTWFTTKYGNISEKTVRNALMSISPEHFAKREKIHRALVCFSKYLIDENVMAAVVVSKIKNISLKRHTPPKRTVISEMELSSLLAVCQNSLDVLIVRLLVSTGLRSSEACNLQMKDIDISGAILTVRLAKWGKTRRVGLTPNAIDAIQGFLKDNPRPNSDDFLLLNRYGNPMARHGLRQRMERLSRDAGVKATPHTLRRAFVTINANKGRPLHHLQIACGHEDIKTTRSYCRTSEDEVVEAMKKWS